MNYRTPKLTNLRPANDTPSWSEPRRPSPAVIIHSSASTGDLKVMSFSLYYYTLGLAKDCERYLALRPRNPPQSQPVKTPSTHPRLVLSPPSWQNFYPKLFVHLVSATPMTFIPTGETWQLSGSQVVDWVRGLDAGGLVASTPLIREVILLDTNAELLQNLYLILTIGSHVDQQMSDAGDRLGLALRVSSAQPLTYRVLLD